MGQLQSKFTHYFRRGKFTNAHDHWTTEMSIWKMIISGLLWLAKGVGYKTLTEADSSEERQFGPYFVHHLDNGHLVSAFNGCFGEPYNSTKFLPSKHRNHLAEFSQANKTEGERRIGRKTQLGIYPKCTSAGAKERYLLADRHESVSQWRKRKRASSLLRHRVAQELHTSVSTKDLDLRVNRSHEV